MARLTLWKIYDLPRPPLFTFPWLERSLRQVKLEPNGGHFHRLALERRGDLADILVDFEYTIEYARRGMSIAASTQSPPSPLSKRASPRRSARGKREVPPFCWATGGRAAE